MRAAGDPDPAAVPNTMVISVLERRPEIGLRRSLAATLAIGGLAGLYPAVRASRLSPTEALAIP